VFRRYRSQPIDRVISLINPMLRGWVNYFAAGHSSECFSYIKDWVEKKVRRAIWRMLGNERASAGSGGVGRGWTRLSSCSTATECDGTDRKLPRRDKSHKPWCEANGGAQCGKAACCVRRGGGWKRGTVVRPVGAPVLDPTDERGQETECCHMAQATAPVLDSTGRHECITLVGVSATWRATGRSDAARRRAPGRSRERFGISGRRGVHAVAGTIGLD